MNRSRKNVLFKKKRHWKQLSDEEIMSFWIKVENVACHMVGGDKCNQR